jgi:hypothetical protein
MHEIFQILRAKKHRVKNCKKSFIQSSPGNFFDHMSSKPEEVVGAVPTPPGFKRGINFLFNDEISEAEAEFTAHGLKFRGLFPELAVFFFFFFSGYSRCLR